MDPLKTLNVVGCARVGQTLAHLFQASGIVDKELCLQAHRLAEHQSIQARGDRPSEEP